MTDVKQVRNVAILGHGNCGKTTLAEAMLFSSGKTNRLGKVDDGSSTMDVEPEVYRELDFLDWYRRGLPGHFHSWTLLAQCNSVYRLYRPGN